ncbi:MAG: hypothetical protein ACREQN_01465 [Candidatus Binataceae bacterium]
MATESPDSWYEGLAHAMPGAFGLPQRLIFLTALLVLLIALNLIAPAHLTPAERALGTAIVVLSAFPSWLWLSGRDRGIPFMPFYGMVFTAYFGIPIFAMQDFSVMWSSAPVPNDLVTRALELTVLGLLLVYLGYYGPQSLVLSELMPRASMRWKHAGTLKFWGIAFGAGGLLIFGILHLLRLPSGLREPIVFAADLCLVGVCILFVLQLTGRLDRLTTLFLWLVLVPARLLLGFGTGSTAQGLEFALTLLLVYSAVRRRMPWKLLLFSGLAFVVLRPAEGTFRMIAWAGGPMEKASQAQKIQLFIRVTSYTTKSLLEGQSASSNPVVQMAMHRLGADVMAFAAVVHDTPGVVPYWGGATYYPLLFKFVPRLIYPDKPEETSGQTFGHRYGLIDAGNSWTAYNLPQIVELYANFGVVGVVVGMFLFGMFYRAILSIFVHAGMGTGALIGAIYMAAQLIAIESATSLMIGDVIWGLIYLALINLVVQSGETHQAPLQVGQSSV